MKASKNFIALTLSLLIIITTFRAAKGDIISSPLSLSKSAQADIVTTLTNQYSGLVTNNNISKANYGNYYSNIFSLVYSTFDETDRKQLSEKVGNWGVYKLAEENGWEKILEPIRRSMPQGPDSVYWDPKNGKVRVVEAKGGTSRLKHTFGSKQGTNRNTIRSARGVLRSLKANTEQKVASAYAIEAGKRNLLESAGCRTPHTMRIGEMGTPNLIGGWDRENVKLEAAKSKTDLIKEKPELTKVFRRAEAKLSFNVWRYRASRIMQFLQGAGAVFLGWDAYQQFKGAFAMLNDPNASDFEKGMRFASAGFHAAEFTSIALCLLESRGWLGNGVFRTAGRTAGRWFLAIAVVAETTSAVITYYDYKAGRISKRDFYKRSIGTAIFVFCTSAGAVIGGIAGASAGGVGAAPGAVAGAGIGAIVAIPIEMVADWTWNWYYRKFDAEQQRIVDRAVEVKYGVQN